MYSVHNEGKFVVAGRFIRILQNEIDKYMISISKNVNIVNKYNNTYHSTIKTRPVDVESDIYTDFDKKNNKEDAKFKVDDHVKISNYKNVFTNGYVPNWSQKVIIKKVKNAVPWTCFISDLNGEGIVGTF